MAPSYDNCSSANYALASGSYRDPHSVATWVNSTRHAPQHDDDAYQLALMNMQAQTGCNVLDTSAYVMPTSTGMEISVSHTGYPQDDDLFYSSGPVFPDIVPSYAQAPAEWGNYDAAYSDPSNACYLNHMDSVTYPDNNSPPLTVATTVSAGSSGSSGPTSANVDDLMYALNFEDSGTGLPSPALDFDSIPIQECEFLGVSKLKMYSGPITGKVPMGAYRPLRSASEKNDTFSDYSSRNPHASQDDTQDSAKPRNDPRYDVSPGVDGLYHCPFYDSESCSHKPTQQKCIYAKYLDSHLRPYKCKFKKPECQEKVFSSNACLFRHEREAHGLHGHGENPYRCLFKGCDRSKPNNGFPRKWNLGDHMKRVHGWREDDERLDSFDSHRKRKGSASSTSVPMKRSSSSQAKAKVASATYSRDLGQPTGFSRHAPRVNYTSSMNRPCYPGTATYPVSMNNVQMAQPLYQQAPVASYGRRQAAYLC